MSFEEVRAAAWLAKHSLHSLSAEPSQGVAPEPSEPCTGKAGAAPAAHLCNQEPQAGTGLACSHDLENARESGAEQSEATCSEDGAGVGLSTHSLPGAGSRATRKGLGPSVPANGKHKGQPACQAEGSESLRTVHDTDSHHDQAASQMLPPQGQENDPVAMLSAPVAPALSAQTMGADENAEPSCVPQAAHNVGMAMRPEPGAHLPHGPHALELDTGVENVRPSSPLHPQRLFATPARSSLPQAASPDTPRLSDNALIDPCGSPLPGEGGQVSAIEGQEQGAMMIGSTELGEGGCQDIITGSPAGQASPTWALPQGMEGLGGLRTSRLDVGPDDITMATKEAFAAVNSMFGGVMPCYGSGVERVSHPGMA